MFEFGPILDITDEPASLYEKALVTILGFVGITANLIPLMFL